jgi:DNA-directed RNA polymerase specialized sigma24 family protein
MTERSLRRDTRRELTKAGFDGLLAAFDADRERAGEKYERVRSKLVLFFERRGAAAPEEQADDTLTRVARKFAEGLRVPPAELHSYVYGVARNVLREGWRATRKTESLEALPPERHPSLDARDVYDPDSVRRIACLGECARELQREDYEFIVQYHSGDGRDRIEGRKALAAGLGGSLNSLRVRAHRIHRRLEACLQECLRRRKD